MMTPLNALDPTGCDVSEAEVCFAVLQFCIQRAGEYSTAVLP
jgi:hypothetical protein